MAAAQESTFGAQLRRYREAAGLSQEDLAERAGLTASAIGALERGERRHPYPHTVQLLAAALGLDEAGRAGLIAAIPRRGGNRPAAEPDSARAAPDVAVPLPEPALPPLPQQNLPQRASAFVGRRTELTRLQSKLAEACGGRGSIVMLVGEAGIGKTRLAREFADQAASEGAVGLWGGCFEGDWQPPYGPWVEALGTYVRARPREEVHRELGPGAALIARLVPDVSAALPDLPLPSPLSPDEERFRLYDAIVRFLLAVSGRRPALLVLDDLHWADPDSLRLLAYLARFVRQARLLVVGAYRDPEFGVTDQHPLMGMLSVLRRESDYERIFIRGFSRDEVGEYLAATAGQALPQALVMAIEEETNGNPFYAREVFRHLTEEAKLLQRGGRWTTDLSIGELGIPEGVRQLVGRRVARLSDPTNALLRLAAGFSTGFGFEVLQALSELPEQTLLDCVDEALQAGLIRPLAKAPSAKAPSGKAPSANAPSVKATTGGAAPRYEFAHAIVRHTLYEGLNPDRRARLHRRIALALERVQGDGKPADAAELAAQYHASAGLAGAAKGIPYALRAAEQARSVYAHDKAAGFLRVARDLAAESPPAERANILRQLAVAEAEAVRLEDARHSADEALEAMSAAGVGAREQAGFVAVVARALKDGGASAPAWEPLVERGLALAGAERDLLWARLALLQDHFEAVEHGPVRSGHWLGQDPEAVAVARRMGDEEDYARTLNSLDWRTLEETEAILTRAATWSQPRAIMRALAVAGHGLLYRHFALTEARRVYDELLAVSQRAGSIPLQAEALTQIAAIQITAGELLPAQETATRARELIARVGAAHGLQFAATNQRLTLAYYLDGDWPALAEMLAGQVASLDPEHSAVGLLAAASLAFVTGRAGNLAEARRLLRHVTEIAERLPPATFGQAVLVHVAATAVWELQAAEHAPTYRRLALGPQDAGPEEPGGFVMELAAARMAALSGDVEEAQEYFARVRTDLDRQGRTHDRGIVDYDEACMLIRAGAADHGRSRGSGRILELLEAALDAFHRHGMLSWARRAAEQKETLAKENQPSPPADHRYPAGLTAREAEVLRLVAAGLTNKDIAEKLVVSLATIERHVANIYGKIGAGRRYEAIAFAQSHGLGPDA